MAMLKVTPGFLFFFKMDLITEGHKYYNTYVFEVTRDFLGTTVGTMLANVPEEGYK